MSMSRVTQGTVQILRDTVSGKTKLLVNPTGNYTLKHKGKTYTVFFRNDFSASLCIEFSEFPINNSELLDILIQASFRNTCLEITIGDTTSEVVGVMIPATPTKPSVP